MFEDVHQVIVDQVRELDAIVDGLLHVKPTDV